MRRLLSFSTILFFLVIAATYANANLTNETLRTAAIIYSSLIALALVVTAITSLKSPNYANMFNVVPFTLIAMVITILVQLTSTLFAVRLAAAVGTAEANLNSLYTFSFVNELHSISPIQGGQDPLAILSLEWLNGFGEEIIFTYMIYTFALNSGKAEKSVAALIAALSFTLFHSRAYVGIPMMQFLLRPQMWSSPKAVPMLALFVTELVKIRLFDRESRRGGGIVGIAAGHMAANTVALMPLMGW